VLLSCVLCAVCCVLCAVCCVLCAVCCVLCAVCCVLCAVCCVLCAVSCVLCAVCCVLCAVCCVMCAVWCVLCVLCVICVLCALLLCAVCAVCSAAVCPQGVFWFSVFCFLSSTSSIFPVFGGRRLILPVRSTKSARRSYLAGLGEKESPPNYSSGTAYMPSKKGQALGVTTDCCFWLNLSPYLFITKLWAFYINFRIDN
jgi:hypothetical protein